MDYGFDDLVGAEFQEQVEFMDGIGQRFGTSDQEGTKQVSQLFVAGGFEDAVLSL